MVKISEAAARAQLETIASKLSQGYTDSEIMRELQISRPAFYRYKSKIFTIWGDIAAKKTEESLEFEADVLKDRYIRLYRLLEVRAGEKGTSLGDVAAAAEVAAQIATSAFKLEFEGMKARQGRALQVGEQKAIRYIGAVSGELSEPDNTSEETERTTAAEAEEGSESAAPQDTDTTVY